MLDRTATHATLLARVADGADPGAWIEFCARYGELIRAFCRARGLQNADIDDIHQDVLLSLTKAMPNFRYDPSRGSFRGYLKTVVLHAIYRRTCQKGPAASLPDIDEATHAAAADTAIDAQWEVQWRQYHLRRAMLMVETEFNETDIAAFESYAVAGRPVAEVASELGVSPDTVYQAKSRILKRLGAIIQQQVIEEG